MYKPYFGFFAHSARSWDFQAALSLNLARFAIHKIRHSFGHMPHAADTLIAVLVAHIVGEHFVLPVFVSNQRNLAVGNALDGVCACKFHGLMTVQVVHGVELRQVSLEHAADFFAPFGIGEQLAFDKRGNFGVFGEQRQLRIQAYRTKKVLFPRTNSLLDKIGATHHQKQRNNP